MMNQNTDPARVSLAPVDANENPVPAGSVVVVIVPMFVTAP